MVAKQIASRYGMHATFMPKPLEHSAGSGLHLYFSWRNEHNPEHTITGHEYQKAGQSREITPPPEYPDTEFIAREEERDRDAQELQAVLHDLHATPDEVLFGIGGLLTHAAACTAICNPTINSYKRLVAAWDAPVYTVWSYRSANALVRIPHDTQHPQVEMRSPDPSCNPYLALAVLIASLVDGLRRRSLPGDAWTGSAYSIDDQTRFERGIRILPRSLREAIEELDKDFIIRNALGDHIYHAFRDTKVAEYEQYRRAVHPWERRAYLHHI